MKESKYVYIKENWYGFKVWNNGEGIQNFRSLKDAKEFARQYGKKIKRQYV